MTDRPTPRTRRGKRRRTRFTVEALECRALLSDSGGAVTAPAAPVTSGQLDRYVNPATGDDANNGRSMLTAWRTVGRLNAALAVAGSGAYVRRVVIDTGPVYPSATPLYLDQPIILHPNAGGQSPDRPLEVTGAFADRGVMADVRGFKVLAGPYLRPNASGYPNVWLVRDSQPHAVLWEDRKWMTHVRGGSFAEVADGINSTPGSFWTAGGVMYFHPFGSTDPNADGKTYERSRYQWDYVRPGNSSGLVLGDTTAGSPIANVFIHHLSIGGTALSQADTGNTQGSYVIGGGTAGVSRIEDCYFYYGGKHLWCQTNDAAGAEVTLEDVQVEQGSPYYAQYPLTSFATRPGVRHTFRRVVSRAGWGAIGSAEGFNPVPASDWSTYFSHDGGGSLASLRFEDCEFGMQIEVAEGTVGEWSVTGTTCPAVVTRVPATIVCEGSTFTYHYPYSTAAGSSITVRDSTVVQTASADYPTWLRGSYRFEGNAFDLRQNPSPGGGPRCLIQPHPVGGFGTIAFVDNAYVGPAGRYYPVFGVLADGQVLECDFNRYRVAPGTPLVWSYAPAGGTPRTLPQWQAAGFDGSSVIDNQPPAPDIVDVSPDPRPGAVDSVTIAFGEPVTGFDLSDLRLTRDGGPNLLTAGQQALTTGDGKTYVLENLAAVTAPRGVYRLTLVAAGSGIRDRVDLAVAAGAEHEWVRGAAVAGRHVFYNNSAFDAGGNDDAAIAPDKAALLPGQKATFANYTSYSRGLNGVTVDIAGSVSGGPVTVDDFVFRVGNDNVPAAWKNTPPAPPTVHVRPGAGSGGSDRVTLTWPDEAIRGAWLEITVLANDRTDLAGPDVFYFGNAVGESGNSAADAVVNFADEAGARTHPASIAPISSRWDYDRDGKVNRADQFIVRRNRTAGVAALRLISVPGPLGIVNGRGVGKRVSLLTEDPHPSPLPEYRERG